MYEGVEVSAVRSSLFGLLLASAGACAAAGPAKKDGEVSFSARDYFPAAVGNSWAYLVERPDTKEPTLAVSQVTRADAASFELKSGDELSSYEIRADGIVKAKAQYYVLKDPLELGARWPILDGKGAVTVEALELVETVPAGRFAACLRIREELFGDQAIEWTYAPGVGPIRMRVFLLEGGAPALIADAQLKAYNIVVTPRP
jgi:hypothetical protein